MRETLESLAAVLVIALQIINMILSKNIGKKVDDVDKDIEQLQKK